MKVYQNTGIGTIYIWMAPFMFAVYDSIYIWMAPANGGPGEWRLPRRMACPGEWPLNGLISAIPCIGSIYAIVDICFILREDRRCVHDLLAQTCVVDIS